MNNINRPKIVQLFHCSIARLNYLSHRAVGLLNHKSFYFLLVITRKRNTPTVRSRNEAIPITAAGAQGVTKIPRALARGIFILTFALCAFNFAGPASADTLISPNYRVEMSNFNMTGGRKTSAGYTLTDSVGQTFQGQFDSAGYTVKAGFQYIFSGIPFTFTISDLDINLGSLVAGTPSTDTNTLTITSGSASGYAVTVIEDHQLRIPGTATDITDTACDTGTPCAITDANVWSSAVTYGFGYNMSGTDFPSADFINSTYYRPFSNAEDSPTPAIVMSKSAVTTGSTATVTYKANVSGSQAAGTYENIVQFIATPTF